MNLHDKWTAVSDYGHGDTNHNGDHTYDHKYWNLIIAPEIFPSILKAHRLHFGNFRFKTVLFTFYRVKFLLFGLFFAWVICFNSHILIHAFLWYKKYDTSVTQFLRYGNENSMISIK